MGRKRRASFEAIGRKPDSLTRHRFADSKYRHNVQYLYSLLRDNSDENYTKDVLLNKVSSDLKKMRNDIIHLTGSQKLTKCNEDFLKIVELGEIIWRDEKNPVVWWNHMQAILKNREERVFRSILDIPVLSVGDVPKERKTRYEGR